MSFCLFEDLHNHEDVEHPGNEFPTQRLRKKIEPLGKKYTEGPPRARKHKLSPNPGYEESDPESRDSRKTLDSDDEDARVGPRQRGYY